MVFLLTLALTVARELGVLIFNTLRALPRRPVARQHVGAGLDVPTLFGLVGFCITPGTLGTPSASFDPRMIQPLEAQKGGDLARKSKDYSE
jgi:hypothetical protein